MSVGPKMAAYPSGSSGGTSRSTTRCSTPGDLTGAVTAGGGADGVLWAAGKPGTAPRPRPGRGRRSMPPATSGAETQVTGNVRGTPGCRPRRPPRRMGLKLVGWKARWATGLGPKMAPGWHVSTSSPTTGPRVDFAKGGQFGDGVRVVGRIVEERRLFERYPSWVRSKKVAGAECARPDACRGPCRRRGRSGCRRC